MRDFKANLRSRPKKIWDFVRSAQGFTQSNDFAQVRTHLQFIASPRSGHTLIGSLLDAHPEMVIAHEMDSMYYFQAGYQAPQIDYLLVESARKFTEVGRQWMGYDYKVAGQWQGKYQQLKVIGDKSGGRSARRIYHAKDNAPLRAMDNKLGNRELVFLYVIRNPFDSITTMMKRTNKRREQQDDQDNLRKKIRHFFTHSKGIEKLYALDKYRVIQVHHEDFVANTAGELQRICEALNLSTDQTYLEACASLVWDRPKKSRHNSELWSPAMIELVQQEMSQYPWFDRYSY